MINYILIFIVNINNDIHILLQMTSKGNIDRSIDIYKEQMNNLDVMMESLKEIKQEIVQQSCYYF